MKVLVIGSGGREHALAWKLGQEDEVLVAPGNAGIDDDFECIDFPAHDFQGIADLFKGRGIDLVVVGPEDPLIAGGADFLRAKGITVYGPGQAGAQLEASKAFSKDIMAGAGIPTARYQTFQDPKSAKDFANELVHLGSMPVIKASGNALGKGVIVCNSIEEAHHAIDQMMVRQEFGEAGSTVVVEERLLGFEFSLLTVCSGTEFLSLPVAQDYKRAYDGDLGPNTGGMGTYSPVPTVTDSLVRAAEKLAVKPLLEALAAKGIDYRGTLFSGFMVKDGTPYCLEYNVRFGDPETQSVMRRLGSGFGQLLMAAAQGNPLPQIEVLSNHAVTVVVASGGYPGSYQKGKAITLPATLDAGVVIFHAGTTRRDGALTTSGGRVFGVSATGETLSDARAAAYKTVEQIRFEGMQFRGDIAAGAL